jgi:hypothetical protein
MSQEYTTARKWSDQFIPYLKMIIGYALIELPEPEEDKSRNTDLIFFSAKNTRIACRVRKNEWLIRSPNDITIRYSYRDGYKTEYQKIMAGWGDYMVYAFASQDENKISAWRVIDLQKFRDIEKTNGITGKKYFTNNDKYNSFMVVDVEKNPGIIHMNSRFFSPWRR